MNSQYGLVTTSFQLTGKMITTNRLIRVKSPKNVKMNANIPKSDLFFFILVWFIITFNHLFPTAISSTAIALTATAGKENTTYY